MLFTKIFVGSSQIPDSLRSNARFTAAVCDLLVMGLIGLVGFRAFSLSVGLLAMALYAGFPLPAAHAHQCAASWPALVPNVLLLWIALPHKKAEQALASSLSFILFGVLFGIAVGLDPRNLMLTATLPFLFLVGGVRQIPIAGLNAERYPVFSSFFFTVLAVATAWMTFRIAQPYAFVERSMVELEPKFVEAGANILLGETAILPVLDAATLDAPGRLAKVFEFGIWGFGPLAFVILLIILFGGVLPRAVLRGDLAPIVLGTVVFAYLALPNFQVHPDPFTIVFACPAAALLIAELVISTFDAPPPRGDRRRQAGGFPIGRYVQGFLIGSGLLATSLSSSFSSGPNPLDTASRWLAEHLPPGKTILVEHQSVRLPGPVDGRVPGPYRFSEFAALSRDFRADEKFFQLQLKRADAIVFSSSATRELAAKNPGPAAEFFRTLSSGSAGFTRVATFVCKPRMLSWQTFRRWVPPEIRHVLCPEVTVFFPSDAVVGNEPLTGGSTRREVNGPELPAIQK